MTLEKTFRNPILSGFYPDPSIQIWPAVPTRDDFDLSTFAFHWNFLRMPPDEFASLMDRPGHLRLQLRPQKLSEHTNPSFVGRRQQHIHLRAQCTIEFAPQNEHEYAGLTLIQNNDFYYLFAITKQDEPVIQLIKRAQGAEEVLSEQPVSSGKLYLKVEAHAQVYNFYVAEQQDSWRPVAENVDGRILSTPVAGGFAGTFIAIVASSNGQSSINHADFDWFEYIGLDH